MKITQRTEPVSRINEHALVQIGTAESKTNKIKVDDLLNMIAQKPCLGALKKAVKQAKSRSSTLNAPLEKPQALRVGINNQIKKKNKSTFYSIKILNMNDIG